MSPFRRGSAFYVRRHRAHFMRFGKVKQQRRVLLLALYILRKVHGIATPRRYKVLRFIRSSGLLFIPPEAEADCSAGCKVWEEELSYHRLALKHEGFLQMPRWGIWEITESGMHDVEAWAHRIEKLTKRKPDWAHNFKAQADPEAEFTDEFHYEFYITEEAVRWGVKIAGGLTK